MKRIFIFLFLTAAASCIDPYIPNLKNYKSLLVVEGLITNQNNTYKIKLCRTTSQESSAPEKIIDAGVSITDRDGIKTILQNCGDGYYKTDSTSFTGIIGQKYTLQIVTADGKEYESEECQMLPVAGIDTMYYEKGEEFLGEMGEVTGISILLNSADATGMNKYFRWTFEEIWKTIMPNPQRYTFTRVNDTTFQFKSVPVIKEDCWKKNLSTEIITNSISSGGTNFINKQLIHFIAPVISDRLTKQYSILVKQYSISQEEYNFWNNLKKVSESGEDIFISQPYSVISNIHNVKNAGEMVLGYFEVSAVSQKRIYITASELATLDIPHYKTDCVEIERSPDDWPTPPAPGWNEIYTMFTQTGDLTFVKPKVIDGTVLESNVYSRNILELVFSTNVCSLCEYKHTGFETKPDFWVDLE